MDENLLRHMILNSIRMYRSKFYEQYGEVVICTDGSANWRKNVYPQYKFKRKESRDASKIDWNELFNILNKIKHEIKNNFPYKFMDINECEADDIIAHLALETQEFGKHEPVMIISADKDFAQLQSCSNVAQYSPMKKGFIRESNPSQNLREHILQGDKSDGVPNVLSDDNCFVEGRRQTPLTKDKIKLLLNNEDALGEEVKRNIQRNRKLIDLRETPQSIVQNIINTYENINVSDNRKKVMTYLIENKCRRLIENLGDFINV